MEILGSEKGKVTEDACASKVILMLKLSQNPEDYSLVGCGLLYRPSDRRLSAKFSANFFG
jgi:hypothetical protein